MADESKTHESWSFFDQAANSDEAAAASCCWNGTASSGAWLRRPLAPPRYRDEELPLAPLPLRDDLEGLEALGGGADILPDARLDTACIITRRAFCLALHFENCVPVFGISSSVSVRRCVERGAIRLSFLTTRNSLQT